MVREMFLDRAKKCICEDRNKQYGSPKNNFREIAKLWSDYLDIPISSADVAMLMCLFKIARIKSSNFDSMDSFVDLAGYAACGGEIVYDLSE